MESYVNDQNCSWVIRAGVIRGRKTHHDSNCMSDRTQREHARKVETPQPRRATHATSWAEGRGMSGRRRLWDALQGLNKATVIFKTLSINNFSLKLFNLYFYLQDPIEYLNLSCQLGRKDDAIDVVLNPILCMWQQCFSSYCYIYYYC